jgi:hypothetical protein
MFCDLLIVGGALLLSLVLIYWWFSRIRIWHYSEYLRRRRPASISISIGGKGRTVVGEDGVERVVDYQLISFDIVKSPFHKYKTKEKD